MRRIRVTDGEATLVDDSAGAEEELRHAELLAEIAVEAERDELRATPEGRRRILEERREQIEAPRLRAFREFLAYGEREGVYQREEARALAEGVGSSGGFIVPAEFYREVLAALKQYDGLFDAAGVVRTPGGGDFVQPLDDDSANAAAIVSENTTSSFVDAAFDRIAFGKCPNWRSGFIKASLELTEDVPNLEALLAGSFGRRFARGIGATFTTTLLGSASVGKTAASATAVTGDEILDLVASVDPAFGQNGGFLMNFTTWTALRKLKGSTSGDYLLPIGRDAAGRPTLFGQTVFISSSMPNMTTGQKSIAFGALDRFVRREVTGSLVVKRFGERFIEAGQIGFEAYWRVDGALAKAANSPVPVKFLQMA